MALPIEIPIRITDLIAYSIFGLEFIIALIAAIYLVRSEHYKRAGVALFVFLLAPIASALLQARVVGLALAFAMQHLVTVIVLILLLFMRKKRSQSDELAL